MKEWMCICTLCNTKRSLLYKLTTNIFSLKKVAVLVGAQQHTVAQGGRQGTTPNILSAPARERRHNVI